MKSYGNLTQKRTAAQAAVLFENYGTGGTLYWKKSLTLFIDYHKEKHL